MDRFIAELWHTTLSSIAIKLSSRRVIPRLSVSRSTSLRRRNGLGGPCGSRRGRGDGHLLGDRLHLSGHDGERHLVRHTNRDLPR